MNNLFDNKEFRTMRDNRFESHNPVYDPPIIDFKFI